MKKWYFLLLIAAIGGGWIAYPHVYPKLTAFVKDGTLPWAGIDKSPEDETASPSDAPKVAQGTTPSDGGSTSGNRSRYAPAPRMESLKFSPIEEITGNWKSIPDSAFPRKTKLRKAVTYSIAGGTGQLASGSEVVALSAAEGVLVVAPNANSKMRAQVSIDDTDFQRSVGGGL